VYWIWLAIVCLWALILGMRGDDIGLAIARYFKNRYAIPDPIPMRRDASCDCKYGSHALPSSGLWQVIGPREHVIVPTKTVHPDGTVEYGFVKGTMHPNPPLR
jgi:hypothetical protein